MIPLTTYSESNTTTLLSRALLCSRAYKTLRRDNVWENVVFKESGGIFTWRNLGASAVQCVREAV